MNQIAPSLEPRFNDESKTDRPDVMSDAEYEEAFDRMRRDYFTGKAHQERPELLYVTGQAGSGKTTYAALAKEERAELRDYVHINFDDLRVYHPRYAGHVEKDPVNAAARIDLAVEKMIGWLCEEAAKNRFNVLLDDAAMGRDLTKMVLSPFSDNGYTIDAYALAVPAPVSRQSVYWRFENDYAAAQSGAPVAVRWVNSQEMDNAPAAFVETMETLERDIGASRITVIDRSYKVLAESFYGIPAPDAASKAVRHEVFRDLTEEEKTAYQDKAEKIAALVSARLNPGAKPAPVAAAAAFRSGTA